MELNSKPDILQPFQGQTNSGQTNSGQTNSGQTYSGQPSGAHDGSSTQLPSPRVLLSPPLKLGQGGFKKVCCTEEAGPCPFQGLAAGALQMRVKEGSKIRNLMGFAMARMQGETGDGASLRQVVFAGSGRAVTKTITCAEIMKRKLGGLHQLTKLHYKVMREVWENHSEGTSKMTVHRTVPSVSILLSKDPLDPDEPGYQPPEALGMLWEAPPQKEERNAGVLCQSAHKRPLNPLPNFSLPGSKKLCPEEGLIGNHADQLN